MHRTYAHTLVVGGTGMLAAASKTLALRSHRLTSVARTLRSLATLDAALADAGCVHHACPLDWTEPERFLCGIERHVAATEPPDLVVAWIHDDELAIRLAERLATARRPPVFVHVVGSSSGDPTVVADAVRGRLSKGPYAAHYRQAILGVRRTGRTVRWLTHEEISSGVVEAIDRAAPTFLIGDAPSR